MPGADRSVLVVGDVVTDVLALLDGPIATGSDTRTSIRIGGGGSAANTAAWLAWLGVPVELVAVVGADAAGAQRLAELVEAGVGCRFVRTSPDAHTGSVVVLTHPQERSMLHDRGANQLLAAPDIDAALAGCAASQLHLSGYTLLDARSRAAGRYALRAAAAHGLATSVDAASAAPIRRAGAAAVREWVAGVDLLLANLDEALALTGQTVTSADSLGLAALLARHLTGLARTAVVKAGAAGAALATSVGGDVAVTTCPAAPAVAMDPTGAGDAFTAGLLKALLAGEPVDRALQAAVALGAQAVGLIGGRPPTRSSRG